MEDTRLTCPFEPSHRINASRMQFHLTKCIKNQTMMGKSVCPYNPLHIYDVNEILHHCKNCPNNATVQQQVYTQEDKKCFANVLSPEEAMRQLAEVLPDDDSWERRHAIQGPGYDPNAEIEKKLVYRSLNVESKSKREKFRMQERRRFAELEREKENFEDNKSLSPQSLRRPRNESVLLQMENTTRKPQSISKAEKLINAGISNNKDEDNYKSDRPQTPDTFYLDSALLHQLKQSLAISDKSECVAAFQELETLEDAKRNNRDQKKKNEEQLMNIKEREAQIRELEKEMESKAKSIDIKNKIIEEREKELLKLLVQKAIQSEKPSTDENTNNKVDASVDDNSCNDKLSENRFHNKKKSSKGQKNVESPTKVNLSNPKCAATFGSSSSLVSSSGSESLSSPPPPQAPGTSRNGNGTRSCGRGIVHAWNLNNLPKIGRPTEEDKGKKA
ncbi:uncharacterized protein [Chelonus insularis]|uniref:uncharacterized protein n=1 Tax=Chelonus insularis TaxID=460826 RepID=UPI00158C8D94|nr:uncharacterized protein LOC118065077 [Chelonus insularis]XP_034936020.1 uncharacterized protein LOC118065077 [Chelonus insularis]